MTRTGEIKGRWSQTFEKAPGDSSVKGARTGQLMTDMAFEAGCGYAGSGSHHGSCFHGIVLRCSGAVQEGKADRVRRDIADGRFDSCTSACAFRVRGADMMSIRRFSPAGKPNFRTFIGHAAKICLLSLGEHHQQKSAAFAEMHAGSPRIKRKRSAGASGAQSRKPRFGKR